MDILTADCEEKCDENQCGLVSSLANASLRQAHGGSARCGSEATQHRLHRRGGPPGADRCAAGVPGAVRWLASWCLG